MHGESTVCASIDLRVHPTVRPLNAQYLEEAAAQSTNSNAESKSKQVILAPYGLAATLTGQSYRTLDAAAQKSYDEWCAFFPFCSKDNVNLPAMVEVMIGTKIIFYNFKIEILKFMLFVFRRCTYAISYQICINYRYG